MIAEGDTAWKLKLRDRKGQDHIIELPLGPKTTFIQLKSIASKQVKIAQKR
jgi:hypothetical protein